MFVLPLCGIIKLGMELADQNVELWVVMVYCIGYNNRYRMITVTQCRPESYLCHVRDKLI